MLKKCHNYLQYEITMTWIQNMKRIIWSAYLHLHIMVKHIYIQWIFLLVDSTNSFVYVFMCDDVSRKQQRTRHTKMMRNSDGVTQSSNWTFSIFATSVSLSVQYQDSNSSAEDNISKLKSCARNNIVFYFGYSGLNARHPCLLKTRGGQQKSGLF